MYQIKHLLTIDAPVPVVYLALTEQEGIAGWWTTDAVTTPTVGSIAGFRFGDRYHNTMRIDVLEPDKRVEWTCLDGDPEWVDTIFVFNLGYDPLAVCIGKTDQDIRCFPGIHLL